MSELDPGVPENTPQRREEPGRLMSAVPVHYGWVVLVAGTLGLIMTSPGQTYAISIFIEHYIRDLGLSRSLVSTLYTVGTLAASLLAPMVGRQTDRRGARWMATVVALLLGLACMYMGLVRGAVTLLVSFTLLRLLGQQSLSLVSSNVINRWWVRRRGMALGIAGLVTSLLGFGAFPVLISRLIPMAGWRGTWLVLGIAVLAVMLPVAWYLYRDEPERYGMRPDAEGHSPEDRPRSRRGTAWVEEHWTAAEAVRTSAFRIVMLALASTSMLGTGLTFHMVSVFEDSGLSAAAAAMVFVPIAAVTALVALASGMLVDRISVKVFLVAALIGQAVVLVMAPRLSGEGVALAYGVVMGVTGGFQRTVGSVVWANYFGRRHLGEITGITTMVGAAASALGPMPMGIARDMLGSYHVTLTAMAALPLVLAVVSLFLRQPKRARAEAALT